MRKRMAVITVLIIGIGCWSLEAVVMAKEADIEIKNTDCLLEDYLDKNFLKIKEDDTLNGSENLLGIGEEHLFEQTRNMFNVEEKETVQEDTDVRSDEENEERDSKELSEEKESSSDESVTSGMKNLQIPQKLGIVIDPWEMDERGQIYSEKYVIRNVGDTAGTLILSDLACKSQKPGKVVVKSDKNGLHDNEEKTLYMEMWFGDSDCVVLSEQGTEYQAELEPDEELTICFAGEVNEYASEGWKKDDVEVSVVYSWNIKETLKNENVDEERVIETDHEENINVTKEVSKEIETRDKEKTIDIEDDFQEDARVSDEENIFYITEEMRKRKENVQEAKENKTKVVGLLESHEMKAVVDFWEVESDHRIVSSQYLIRNIGEKTGIFSLTDIICRPKEESGIDVKLFPEEVQERNGKAVFMEMIFENEDRVVLAQTSSEYNVELKAGEEITVQFIGVMNIDLFENWEEDDVIIDARGFWNVEK